MNDTGPQHLGRQGKFLDTEKHAHGSRRARLQAHPKPGDSFDGQRLRKILALQQKRALTRVNDAIHLFHRSKLLGIDHLERLEHSRAFDVEGANDEVFEGLPGRPSGDRLPALIAYQMRSRSARSHARASVSKSFAVRPWMRFMVPAQVCCTDGGAFRTRSLSGAFNQTKCANR
ncbi:MAG TPA: hypothetical protein VFS20_30330 [Longimicrobium sp.]|nr:hypothetical protein [Longimicrobium sp.]